MLDLLSTAWSCVAQMFEQGRSTGLLVSLSALLAAAGCTYLCHSSGWFWNKKYHQTLTSSALSLLAGFLALASVMVFAGAGYIKETAVRMIEIWSQAVSADSAWQEEVFQSTKMAIADLKDSAGRPIEDYNLPDPDGRPYKSPDSRYIPLNSGESREICALTYAAKTITSFKARHPVLGRLLFADEDTTAGLILDDVKAYFTANKGGVYPVNQGFKLGVGQIMHELESGTGRLIKIARISVALFFLLVEGMCFAGVGLLAWRELKYIRKRIQQ